MSRETASARRVGLMVLVAATVGAGTLLILGEHQNLFTTKNDYRIRFENVSGLAVGSAVQLNGVDVGSVSRIVLPTDMETHLLEVWIRVDARYAQRIREDSEARIKTLGLLGDKFIDVTSGSPAAELVPPGGDIPTAPATDVDRLAAAGEDVVNNIARLSHQLTDILGRLERGEGLFGKLLLDKEAGDRVSRELEETLVAVHHLAVGLDDRHGVLGRLVHDRELGDHFAHTIEGTNALIDQVEHGDGLVPALLFDKSYRDRFASSLDHLDSVTERLSSLADKLDHGNGLLPKLISDDEYGQEMAKEPQGPGDEPSPDFREAQQRRRQRRAPAQ